MAQTEIDPAQAIPPAGRKTRMRIAWTRGAALLVAGEAPADVAAALGITEERLWRHLRNSARFQFLLRQAREAQLLIGRLQLEAASNAAAIRCAQKAEKPPAALFEQFKSTSHPAWDKPSAVDGRDLVLRLADSQRRAPKRPPRPAKAAGEAAGSANKTQISENKTQISQDKDAIGTQKSPVSADKPVDKTPADADKPLKDQPVEPQRLSLLQQRAARQLQNSVVPGRTDVFGRPLPDVDAGAPRLQGWRPGS